MDKKPDSTNPPVPSPLPLPAKVNDFFNAAAPRRDSTPLIELQKRYADKRAEDRLATNGTPPMSNYHGTEFIVEMRIREWMMRMEREAADERRSRAALEAAQKAKPPAPQVPK